MLHQMGEGKWLDQMREGTTKIKWLDQEGLRNETIKIKGKGWRINKIVRSAAKGKNRNKNKKNKRKKNSKITIWSPAMAPKT